MSSVEEAELGGRFDLEVRAKLPLLRDLEVEGYINQLGQRIVAGLEERDFEYSFTPLRDDRINAFAVPGGFVYVNAGLLVRAGNEDEVAGVLGHEIAHVQAHHLARQQKATQLLNYAAIAGMILSAISPAIGAAAIGASSAAQLQYSREYEQEADYLGARYMRAGGYDPRGMLDFFTQLQKQQLASPTLIPPYLLTHPLTQDRLTNLEAVLRQRQWDKTAPRPASLDLERVRLLARLHLEPIPTVLGDYRRAAEEKPEDARAQYLFGLALLQSGNAAGARQAFERSAQLGLSAVADRELGRAALMQRQLQPARVYFERATAADPNDALAFRELGRTLEAAGESDKALTAFKRAAELAPRDDEVQYSLGMLAGRTGHPAEGYYHLGRAMWLRGDAEQALSQFEKAEQTTGAGSWGQQASAARQQLLRILDQ